MVKDMNGKELIVGSRVTIPGTVTFTGTVTGADGVASVVIDFAHGGRFEINSNQVEAV